MKQKCYIVFASSAYDDDVGPFWVYWNEDDAKQNVRDIAVEEIVRLRADGLDPVIDDRLDINFLAVKDEKHRVFNMYFIEPSTIE